MRSCLGIVLLIILVLAIAITAFFQWDSNNHMEFSTRGEDDPAFKESETNIKDHLPVEEKPRAVAKDVMQMQVAPQPEQPEPLSPADGTAPAAAPEQPGNEDIPIAEPVVE